MMGSKRRASRDMARMDGNHFSLDTVLTVLSFLILVVVVVIPMVMIVYNTFFYEGKFDTSLFTQIILDPGNVAAMWNTIKIALLVTLFGTILGLFFAWLLGRSDIPFKGLMRSMFTIPYMFPPFFGAMAWELLLSPRSGYLNKWLMATFGLSKAPFNINSIGGIIFVECSYYFPFVFMQVVSALERMDPTLEESARIAGAKQWYVIRRITMPLVLPATSAGALLILTSSLSHFGVPSILGFSKKIYTLPTRIYQLISRASGSFQGIREGAALSILLVIVVMLALWLQKIVLRSGSYDIIKGKSMRPMLIKLRGAKIPLLVISLLSLVVIVVVPLVMIILVGLLKAYGLPLKLENFTFDNYINLFKSKMVKRGQLADPVGLRGSDRHVPGRDDRLRHPEDPAEGQDGAGDHLHPAVFHPRHRAGHRRHPLLERRVRHQPVQHPVDHPDCVYRALPRLLDEVRLRVPAAGSLFAGRRGAHLRRDAF